MEKQRLNNKAENKLRRYKNTETGEIIEKTGNTKFIDRVTKEGTIKTYVLID